ncbi:hypothetical protein J4232_02235 [Candidatus Woesearchaeota archaeon]|nr:hypothetical protein [Candidatus Woesearchaeota archaeon]
MAATPKGTAKVKAEYVVEKEAYDNFVRYCSKKGLAPNVMVERYMKEIVARG